MVTFNLVLPEVWLQLPMNYEKPITGTGTYTPVGKISFLVDIIHCEKLQEYELLITTCRATTNAHLSRIFAGLTKYLLPANMIANESAGIIHTTIYLFNFVRIYCSFGNITVLCPPPSLWWKGFIVVFLHGAFHFGVRQQIIQNLILH